MRMLKTLCSILLTIILFHPLSAAPPPWAEINFGDLENMEPDQAELEVRTIVSQYGGYKCTAEKVIRTEGLKVSDAIENNSAKAKANHLNKMYERFVINKELNANYLRWEKKKSAIKKGWEQAFKRVEDVQKKCGVYLNKEDILELSPQKLVDQKIIYDNRIYLDYATRTEMIESVTKLKESVEKVKQEEDENEARKKELLDKIDELGAFCPECAKKLDKSWERK